MTEQKKWRHRLVDEYEAAREVYEAARDKVSFHIARKVGEDHSILVRTRSDGYGRNHTPQVFLTDDEGGGPMTWLPAASVLRDLADLREHFDRWVSGEEEEPLPPEPKP